ncbi:MAG: alpha/beta hydrolase-fold protein [Candidatus Acidiferrum sp.]
MLLCCWVANVPLAAATDLPTVLPQNVKIVQFPSASLGDQRTMLVMLPVDYDGSVSRYPTLYLLHGYDADITDWARGTDLSAYAARHHLIIVTPDASRGWYLNSVANPKARFDDYIMKDVIPYVDAHFRTIPEPFARAIAGVSMGGFGAMFLGLEHRDQFAAIGSFSGALAVAHNAPPPLPADASDADRKERKENEGLAGPFGSQEHKDAIPLNLPREFQWRKYLCCLSSAVARTATPRTRTRSFPCSPNATFLTNTGKSLPGPTIGESGMRKSQCFSTSSIILMALAPPFPKSLASTPFLDGELWLMVRDGKSS